MGVGVHVSTRHLHEVDPQYQHRAVRAVGETRHSALVSPQGRFQQRVAVGILALGFLRRILGLELSRYVHSSLTTPLSTFLS